jgi:peptidoglycan/xylan/chitin deacetylase (PgdA/CDA1 family)
MHRKGYLLRLLFFLSVAAFLRADDGFPSWKVVPWDGHKAACSLTFDDGDPAHLDVAIPELNERKMHGTFFLIANRIDRKDEWRRILEEGHEIGNHTLDHKHAGELTPADEESQVVGAQHVLQKEFGVQVLTFAYPYGEGTPGLRAQIQKGHLLARGVGRQDLILPQEEPDWWYLPSYSTMTATPYSTYQEWIDEDLEAGAWMIWTIHGLEGTPWGYQPIAKKTFERILDYLQAKDIWVGTLVEIGAYFRAQKILEKSPSSVSGTSKEWSWTVPDVFPRNVLVKVRLVPTGNDGGVEVWQGRQKISPDSRNCYPVKFNVGRLTLRLLPK